MRPNPLPRLEPAALRCVALLCLSLAAGCASFDAADYATLDVSPAPAAEYADFGGIPVRSGQVIVGEKGAALGFLVALFAADYYPFGHSGIVVVENGRPFVYEPLGVLRPLRWGSPTAAMGGRVFRTPLAQFLARQRIAAVFDPPSGVAAERVAAYAVEQHRRRTPFDAYFDAADDTRLYCSEFVARALEAGGAAPVAGSRRLDNASLRTVLRWLEVDAPSFVMPGAVLRDSTRVALLAPRYTPAQVAAHFEVRRELHRRFTPDQPLGNVFHWRRTGPVFRDEVAVFINDTVAGYRDRDVRSEAAVRAEVQTRALRAFGPAPAP